MLYVSCKICLIPSQMGIFLCSVKELTFLLCSKQQYLQKSHTKKIFFVTINIILKILRKLLFCNNYSFCHLSEKKNSAYMHVTSLIELWITHFYVWRCAFLHFAFIQPKKLLLIVPTFITLSHRGVPRDRFHSTGKIIITIPIDFKATWMQKLWYCSMVENI